MVNPSIIVEICVDSVESAVAAEQGGAHRVELCGSLIEGGVTPSAGLIEAVRSRISIPLHVIVRPRGGDFCYGAEELEVMWQDVLTAKKLRVDGVVFGILREDGSVNVEQTRSLVELAHPMSATFHRAIDMSKDMSQALEDVIAAGATRVLTSGAEETALAGAEMIGRLVRQAGGRIAVMAGSGINHSNLCELIAKTGVREIHASLRTTVASRMHHRNERVSMGALAGQEYERRVVMKERVAELIEATRSAISN